MTMFNMFEATVATSLTAATLIFLLYEYFGGAAAVSVSPLFGILTHNFSEIYCSNTLRSTTSCAHENTVVIV